MLPLALLIHIFVGSTLAGSAVIAVLTLGYGTLTPILVAAVAGFVAGVPASWVIAKKLAG